MTARTRIVRIGNSRGIRVPKALLEKAGLPQEVEVHAQPGRLVVSATTRPRSGWAAKARAMHQRRDDELLNPGTRTEFDDTHWRW